MESASSILSECDGLGRAQQIQLPNRLEPSLRIWDGPHAKRPFTFLVVTTWSLPDGEALEDYLRVEGERMLALHGWFQTRQELQDAAGYDGPCLQSPILVIRDSLDAVVWSGEGYFARKELKRRVELPPVGPDPFMMPVADS